MTELISALQILVLLGIANGAPIFAKKLLQSRFDMPLDCGLILPDKQPLLGAAKTFRGIIASVACTAGAAFLLNIGWSTGAKVALFSMLGDLFSSFVKRRLHLAPHAQSFGLDQIPEALLPILSVRQQFALTGRDVAVLIIAFILLEIVASRILFRLKIRDRPY